MTHADYLITLHVPPSLEEAVVDCLLSFETAQGFSSFAVNAHHHSHHGSSLAELVSGRQGKISFQMYVEKDEIAAVLNQLKTDFAGAGLHYWVTPVIEQGLI
ncbi:MAG: DUF3240 family protein [Methylomonas sp.]